MMMRPLLFLPAVVAMMLAVSGGVAAQDQSMATPEAVAALPDRPGKAGIVQ